MPRSSGIAELSVMLKGSGEDLFGHLDRTHLRGVDDGTARPMASADYPQSEVYPDDGTLKASPTAVQANRFTHDTAARLLWTSPGRLAEGLGLGTTDHEGVASAPARGLHWSTRGG